MRSLCQAEDGIRDLSVDGVQTCAFLISSRRRHTRFKCDWSSDVCSSDLFSDGTSQVGSITTHTFTSPKLYTVKLTVTDNNGNMGSTVKQVQVQPALTVAFTSDSAGGTAPTTVNFSATASWGVGPYTFSWGFGDGQKATGPSQAHNYTVPKSYTAQVTVTDSIRATTSGNVAT